MGKIADVQEVTLEKLVPYVNNAKIHSEEQVAMIASSIREFGFLSPVLIDRDYNIIAGHGRVMAAKKLEMESVPCVFVEGLTKAQRKAYILADNRLSDLGTWDMEIAAGEFEELRELNFDLSLTGFSFPDLGDTGDWFADRERNDTSRQEGNEEYNEFLDKFEQAKTTDDCYTPDLVYEAVADWVANEYGVDRKNFIRPFYPGGDYQAEKYKKTDIVVDNPPFSILSEILKFYTEKGVRFFLFAPALTLFSSSSSACAIGAGAQIVYENNANVSTSFLTNLEMEYRFRTAPTLYKAVQDAIETIRAENQRELAKNDFPDYVITSTKLSYFSKYGIDFKVKRENTEHIRQLDAQKEKGTAIFGSGYLISEKAAAEKAAAEKAAATVWQLSDREKQIVKSLGNLK